MHHYRAAPNSRLRFAAILCLAACASAQRPIATAESPRNRNHWSFQPIRSSGTPTSDPGATAAQIDQLVAQALRQQGLTPSPEADRTTLLRRLSLDLIGLPPSPEEAAAFAVEDSASAYERKVDSLLASPHYGERLAMWWLDLVRYADTVGYHGDQPISASPCSTLFSPPSS